MVKKYEARAWTEIDGDPDPNNLLTSGTIPASTGEWVEYEIGSTPISVSRDYYYHDANNLIGGVYSDANATRVKITIEQTWSTSVDNYNNLTVNLTSRIGPLVRDNRQGTCSDTPGREILVFAIGAYVNPITYVLDNQVGTERTLDNNVQTVTTEITIPPGGSTALEDPTIWIVNQTVGGPSYDTIFVGLQFKNSLPPDYRPGATNDNSVWQSHNRPTGNSHVYDGTKFIEMRTIGAPTEMGMPPSILHDNKWYNMAKIGKDADV